MFFDPNYLLLVMIPSLILSLGAQMFVQSAYKKWGNTRNGSGLTGAQVGQRILQTSGLHGVRFEGTAGELTDHYDPSNHTVRMSQGVATVPSVAAMAIVAHELGHAQQYEEKSPFIAMRSFLVPAMQFSPMISYALILAGLLFSIMPLAWLGIGFFAIVVGFMLLTLPVEFDASRRGLKLLEQSGLMVTAEDRNGARQILTAAALTYVAAFISSLLTLIYYISLVSRRD
ncbi:MAG: zinc metallopeptidase [Phototrophicales bacterium]|nr:MAG: flagellar biosynthesis protein FlgM [Phototrophicales bacterium]RMG76153.1 MAG: zinc metallopeptidase [Chloroflexota bacterium]